MVVRHIRHAGLGVFTFLLTFYKTAGHPQCLDFSPPFQVNDPGLSFCSEYSNFTCCNREKDAQIRNSYTSLSAEVVGNGQTQCRERLRDLLCIQCSPYEAHVYDGEMNDRRQFPGLCDPYCRDLYRDCPEAILLVADTPGIRTSLDQGVDAFCDSAALPDQDYCFPELGTREELQGDNSGTNSTAERCICLQEFADKMMNPLIFVAFPDDSGRILVGERRGILYVYFVNKTRLFEPFMDISHIVRNISKTPGERGMRSLAFHPSFNENHKFYIVFSITKKGLEMDRHIDRISEFEAEENSVKPNSERHILEVPQPTPRHNVNQVS